MCGSFAVRALAVSSNSAISASTESIPSFTRLRVTAAPATRSELADAKMSGKVLVH